MRPLTWVAGAVGGYFLLSGRARAAIADLGGEWRTAPIEELSARYAGADLRDVPAGALQRLFEHAVARVNAGPAAPGLYGEKILTPVPGQVVKGQVFHFWRWPPDERLRDMAPLLDPGQWKNPAGRLYLVPIKGQPKYGFIDKAAGVIKRSGAINFVEKLVF